MMVEVERFDISRVPEHGRPRVAQFRVPKKGSIDVRVERESGALWLFVNGPSGGDRGRLVFGVKRAGDVLAYVTRELDDPRSYLYSNDYRLSFGKPLVSAPEGDERRFVEDEETTDRFVRVHKGSSINPWAARFDAAALDELRTCLREWAAAVVERVWQPPAAGEFFVRGDTPGGTVEQVRAWVQAGPEGRLCQIRDDAADGHVVFRDVLRLGGLGSAHRASLAEFYGAGWRRLGCKDPGA